MPHVNDFIRSTGEVVDDGVPPKSDGALVAFDVASDVESLMDTVASDVDGQSAMTWRAKSANFLVVGGFKVCSLSCPEQQPFV